MIPMQRKNTTSATHAMINNNAQNKIIELMVTPFFYIATLVLPSYQNKEANTQTTLTIYNKQFVIKCRLSVTMMQF